MTDFVKVLIKMKTQIENSGSKKFFLTPPYIYLVNPDMISNRNIHKFPLVKVLKEFQTKMDELSEVDYKIMGLCIQTTARIHRMRVAKAVSLSKEQERDYEIRKKKEEFIFDKPLKQYMRRSELEFSSDTGSDAFYEQLLISLRSEGKRRERKRKKAALLDISDSIEDIEDVTIRKGRISKRIRVDDPTAFEAVVIDFDRIEIDSLINDVLYAIRAYSKEENGKELILFDDVINFRVKGSKNTDKWRLEQVRILISLLYLIKEGLIEAWQDIETKMISIILTEKGMVESFGTKERNVGSL